MLDLPFSREEIMHRLYTAVLSDVLDSRSVRDRAMRPFVRPLDESSVLFGRARTGTYASVYHTTSARNPYEVEIALVDDLQAGDVAVLACQGPTDRIAPWGELLTTAAMGRGGVGCVTDGLVRDIKRIRAMQFPIFCGGLAPLDTKGRAEMYARDVPVECGGVRVEPGDLVFGDADGLVVLPRAIADDVLVQAMDKIASEDLTRRDLLAGHSLREVFDRHKVL
jgi:4-hydroxy-4-methyl-2-oxoglutarate aldolase